MSAETGRAYSPTRAARAELLDEAEMHNRGVVIRPGRNIAELYHEEKENRRRMDEMPPLEPIPDRHRQIPARPRVALAGLGIDAADPIQGEQDDWPEVEEELHEIGDIVRRDIVKEEPGRMEPDIIDLTQEERPHLGDMAVAAAGAVGRGAAAVAPPTGRALWWMLKNLDKTIPLIFLLYYRNMAWWTANKAYGAGKMAYGAINSSYETIKDLDGKVGFTYAANAAGFRSPTEAYYYYTGFPTVEVDVSELYERIDGTYNVPKVYMDKCVSESARYVVTDVMNEFNSFASEVKLADEDASLALRRVLEASNAVVISTTTLEVQHNMDELTDALGDLRNQVPDREHNFRLQHFLDQLREFSSLRSRDAMLTCVGKTQEEKEEVWRWGKEAAPPQWEKK
jgi:hypothetical protein